MAQEQFQISQAQSRIFARAIYADIAAYILRLCRSEFSKVDDVVPVIELLIEYGYLKERTYSAPTGGRPRGNGYLLNPLFFDK